MPPPIQCTDEDVLCGRSKAVFNHGGNMRLRTLVRQYLPQYVATQSRPQRSVIISSILGIVQSSGGRFLKIQRDCSYSELSKQDAREKIGHALRDAKAIAMTNSTDATLQKGQTIDSEKTTTSENQPLHSTQMCGSKVAAPVETNNVASFNGPSVELAAYSSTRGPEPHRNKPQSVPNRSHSLDSGLHMPSQPNSFKSTLETPAQQHPMMPGSRIISLQQLLDPAVLQRTPTSSTRSISSIGGAMLNNRERRFQYFPFLAASSSASAPYSVDRIHPMVLPRPSDFASQQYNPHDLPPYLHDGSRPELSSMIPSTSSSNSPRRSRSDSYLEVRLRPRHADTSPSRRKTSPPGELPDFHPVDLPEGHDISKI